MRALTADQKRSLQGGLALSTIVMGATFVLNTLMGLSTSIAGAIAKNTPAPEKVDNSWAQKYNTSSGSFQGVTMAFG